MASKVLFAKVNLDENQNLAMKYSIRSIPSLLIFKEGEVVASQVGALSKAQLAEFIESNI